MKTVLEKLLRLVTDKLQVSAADVLLFDSESGALKYAAGKDIQPAPAFGAGIVISKDYAGKSITANQIVSVTREQNLLDGFSRSWKASLKDYQHYEAIPLISQGMPKGVLELFYLTPPSADAEWTDFLSSIASQLAITLDNLELFEKLRISNLELTTAYDATIEGWSKAMELRDQETEGHAERVVDITISLARAVGVPEASLEHVRRGALLHDIGKMAIPDSILFKQGPLTAEETRIMKQHPTFARQLLSPIAYLRPALDIPYCHHEQWDGSGYPQGLKGKEIPLYARIFTIVDVWDALRSDRPYRKSWAEEKVKVHIQRAAGQAFDAEIVDVFIKDVLPGITGANSKSAQKKS
jgi:putative nucleotidyltransferase with HDIG domain